MFLIHWVLSYSTTRLRRFCVCAHSRYQVYWRLMQILEYRFVLIIYSRWLRFLVSMLYHTWQCIVWGSFCMSFVVIGGGLPIYQDLWLVRNSHRGLRELGELHATYNKLFNLTEGKPNDLEYAKKVLVVGTEKLSTKPNAALRRNIRRLFASHHLTALEKLLWAKTLRLWRQKEVGKVEGLINIPSDLCPDGTPWYQSGMFAQCVVSQGITKEFVWPYQKDIDAK